MGSYATLSVGNYDFLLSKNHIGSHLLLIYNSDDKTVEKCTDEDGEEHTQYSYKTTVIKAKQCLDVLGYTLANSKKRFHEYQPELEFTFELTFEDSFEKAFSEFTFETWSNTVVSIAKDLIAGGIDYGRIRSNLDYLKMNCDFTKYIVVKSLDYNNDLYFGMPYEMDPWYIIRIIFENLPNETEVVLDYTSLIDGGWYDSEHEIESFHDPKIIVMTEGKTDSKIIAKSLKILYPHLYYYYYFMDFDNSNAQGSTSFLTHYIKAFIGAGIDNPIIALFDNDAAAKCEIINLEKITIPPNIRILTLPDIELANYYPTIGPFNSQNANINGLACSIELFLGKEVLSNEKGDLIPVIWKGYIDRINKYQGEIMSKDIVQQRFFKVIEQIENGSLALEEHDWSAMEKLLHMLFNAFN